MRETHFILSSLPAPPACSITSHALQQNHRVNRNRKERSYPSERLLFYINRQSRSYCNAPNPTRVSSSTATYRTRHLLARVNYRPVEPKPPAPRAVSDSASVASHSTRAWAATTICAMRSPGLISKSASDKFTRITLISPR